MLEPKPNLYTITQIKNNNARCSKCGRTERPYKFGFPQKGAKGVYVYCNACALNKSLSTDKEQVIDKRD